jgi:hypothetical protein
MIYVKLKLDSHSLAVVQYTYTKNKQNDTKQTIHRITQSLEECGPCPVFAVFTLAFALQLKKKHGKTSVRVAIHKHIITIHGHNNKNT